MFIINNDRRNKHGKDCKISLHCVPIIMGTLTKNNTMQLLRCKIIISGLESLNI